MIHFPIEPTKHTPRVIFNKDKKLMEIRGKSYPPDILDFYNPIFTWLIDYLNQPEQGGFTLNIELVYFNSSSSKILMELFDLLDDAAAKGQRITINWIYDGEDEDNREFGEEFREDLNSVVFNLTEKEWINDVEKEPA